MRVALLYLIVAAFAIYAYRNWFVALCGSIVLMAVMQHPDMPKSILGIQGFNLWNALFANVFIAWYIARRREALVWDLPQTVAILFAMYAAAVLVGFARMVMDPSYLEDTSIPYLISEYLVNTFKWFFPALLFYDGCRTRARVIAAVLCVLAVYFLLALQVIRWMPSGNISGRQLTERSRKILQNEIGYHAVNLSMMLAGACWATLAILPLVKRWKYRLLVIAAALTMAYGQALTGGRTGYGTWALVGLILCIMSWRKFLILVPVAPFIIAILVPGAVERMTMGFGGVDSSGEATTDQYQVTSGRNIAWPLVIDKIADSPVIGYGRLAMIRTGLTDRLLNEYGEEFPHPHNVYLECLLDNGALGALMILPIYIYMLIKSAGLFLSKGNPIYRAVGGTTLALILALLIAGIGSQTFYPREGAVGMWAAIGIMMRLAVAHASIRAHQGASTMSARSAPGLVVA